MGIFKDFADMNEREIDQLTTIFKILSDPTRIKLILLLSKGEYCVAELSDQIGTTPSAVSHQISLLRAKRLLHKRKSGKHAYYTLVNEHIGALIAAGRECLR